MMVAMLTAAAAAAAAAAASLADSAARFCYQRRWRSKACQAEYAFLHI